jgi:tRNA pseudouridine55 synthase
MQVPPKFSAIKINGQRAYKLARKGEDFTPTARPY